MITLSPVNAICKLSKENSITLWNAMPLYMQWHIGQRRPFAWLKKYLGTLDRPELEGILIDLQRTA